MADETKQGKQCLRKQLEAGIINRKTLSKCTFYFITEVTVL